jgi:hypothetical protein
MSERPSSPWIDNLEFTLRLLLRRISRCKRALLWLSRVLMRQILVRRRIAAYKGREWVQQNLPTPSYSEIFEATTRVLQTAWLPAFQQEAIQRSTRLRRILVQLQSLKRPTYRLTTVTSQRVYEAALMRCVNAICERPLAPEAMHAIIGPLGSSPTGLAHFLVTWLSRRFANEPETWGDNMPTSLTDNFEQSVSSLESTLQPAMTCVPVANSRVIRREIQEDRRQLEATASLMADQALACVVAEQELRWLAMPSAVLEACHRPSPAR